MMGMTMREREQAHRGATLYDHYSLLLSYMKASRAGHELDYSLHPVLVQSGAGIGYSGEKHLTR
jgi:hypothetical protein